MINCRALTLLAIGSTRCAARRALQATTGGGGAGELASEFSRKLCLATPSKTAAMVGAVSKWTLCSPPPSPPLLLLAMGAVPGVKLTQSRKLHLSCVRAGPRMITIRRKKMRKHKRRKRWDRDWFQYQKYHARKKEKAEVLFRGRMKALLTELDEYDPMEYVKDTMRKARREWNLNLAPSGRTKYAHWSQMMSLEELYGLDKNADYIDKRFGLPDEEDAAKFAHLRDDYLRRYTRDPSPPPHPNKKPHPDKKLHEPTCKLPLPSASGDDERV